ncbi:hypothetical protein [Desulfonatronospira sp.]|uniref:hypothetical protein n=1 Tax=Desulfonatronospira sp. TaxID=1962951 RepID=UPI0025C08334|nr:hypothetical protein [Desulfonatronospira sp.]
MLPLMDGVTVVFSTEYLFSALEVAWGLALPALIFKHVNHPSEKKVRGCLSPALDKSTKQILNGQLLF